MDTVNSLENGDSGELVEDRVFTQVEKDRGYLQMHAAVNNTLFTDALVFACYLVWKMC